MQFAMPKDRKLVLEPDGGDQKTVVLPDTAGSAIIFVNAPGSWSNAFTCRVFSLEK